MTESWVPSRGLGFMDPRAEKLKLAMVEFAAHSDMRRRMTLGLQYITSHTGIITIAYVLSRVPVRR